MGREIKRVVAGFDWPIGKAWEGFLNPHYKGHCRDCGVCGGSGYSPYAKLLQDQWYGNAPFRPEETGSPSYPFDHPQIVRLAERNVNHSPEYYGTSATALMRECVRLSELFNSSWNHHLSQLDVDALLKAGRLMDFTHTPRNDRQREIVREKIAGGGNSWLPRSNGYRPRAREVNEWSIGGFGHDSINSWLCIKAKCRRMKMPYRCAACRGECSVWDSPENKRRAENWKMTEPPTGDWWQVWETVSEGSPVTPAFSSAEELADYLVFFGDAWDQKRGDGGWDRRAAEQFVGHGHAFSMIGIPTPEGGVLLEPRDGCLV